MVELNLVDEGAFVSINAQLDPKLMKEQLDVRISGDSLFAAEKGSGQQLFKVVQLYGTIDAGSASWDVTDGHFTAKLKKLDAGQRWPSLTPEPQAAEVGASPSGEGSEAGRALAAREQVAEVLGAAQEGDVAAFKAKTHSFAPGELPQVKDGNGRNALHFAAQQGRTQLCRYLLAEGGFDVNTQDEAGETALALAAGAGQARAVELLLAEGADPLLKREGSAAAIHRAAGSGDTAVLRLLLARDASQAGLPSETGAPLLWAAGSGHAGCVAALLEAGADPNARDANGVGAVLMAAASGSTEVLDALVKSGADVNLAAEAGVTALHAASEMGQGTIVKVLLQAGADPNLEDKAGSRAIDAAAAEGHSDIVAALLPLTKPPTGGDADWSVEAVMEDARQKQQRLDPGSGEASSSGLEEEITIPEAEAPDPAAAATAKREGDEAFVRGNLTAAEAAYSRALRHDTASAVLWANRSATLLRLERPKEALADARRARTLDASYTKAWFREGSAAQQLQLWEAAALAFFEGYRLDPGNRQLAAAFQAAVQHGRAAEQR